MKQKSAVLIDGTALYMAVRALYGERQLDYQALIQILMESMPILSKPGSDNTSWVMWTAASPQNIGQNKFLEFVENELKWEVRKTDIANSYLIEPVSIFDLSKTSRNRLIRFDANIAFALGRLANFQHIVVISDSYALMEPMARVSAISRTEPFEGTTLAFFGNALESRIHSFLRNNSCIHLLDLDESEVRLFGSRAVTQNKKEVTRDELF